ncbi:MAG: redoxin domain-containing protein [Candidatus Edwardsbacteria bacterium]
MKIGEPPLSAFVCLYLCWLANSGWAINAKSQEIPKIGQPAPTFFLPQLDGNKFYLSDYCGRQENEAKPKPRKTVVLNFLTTYCKFCKQEIPVLNSLVNKFPQDSIVLAFVDVGEKKDTVEAHFKDKSFNRPVLIDQFSAVADKYKVKNFPTTVVIDTLGIVRFYGCGYTHKNIIKIKNILNILFNRARAIKK